MWLLVLVFAIIFNLFSFCCVLFFTLRVFLFYFYVLLFWGAHVINIYHEYVPTVVLFDCRWYGMVYDGSFSTVHYVSVPCAR